MNLIHGDCLEKLKEIADGSVDMVLADLPYGTTACKWDTRIPFEPLWEQLHRVCKPNAAMAMFGSEPFSSLMRMSNLKRFKYDWIWNKIIPSGMSYAKYRPMGQHEIISVFCDGKTKYNPQKTKRDAPISHGSKHKEFSGSVMSLSGTNSGSKRIKSCMHHDKNPMTIIPFDKVRRGSQHPTQKPVALLEYLIKTYTNEGDTVLDPTMGSGSTGVACCNLKRHFIGIEKELNYFEIAQKRIG